VAEGVRRVTTQIVSGAVIGIVVAIASAWVSHLLTLKRERERWKHEECVQQQTREHEWQIGHRDDRLELYRQFLVQVRGIKPEYSPFGFHHSGTRRAENTLREIGLLGSEQVREAAANLLAAQANVADFQGRVKQRGDSEAELLRRLEELDPRSKQELERREQELHAAYPRSLTAARKDLGMGASSSKQLEREELA
jgi:hypothetical protein